MNKHNKPIEFSKCLNKDIGYKYLQDFDGICYDCCIENNLLFQECKIYFDNLRQTRDTNDRT